MPQFDIETFPSQVLWIFYFAFVLAIFFSSKIPTTSLKIKKAKKILQVKQVSRCLTNISNVKNSQIKYDNAIKRFFQLSNTGAAASKKFFKKAIFFYFYKLKVKDNILQHFISTFQFLKENQFLIRSYQKHDKKLKYFKKHFYSKSLYKVLKKI